MARRNRRVRALWKRRAKALKEQLGAPGWVRVAGEPERAHVCSLPKIYDVNNKVWFGSLWRCEGCEQMWVLGINTTGNPGYDSPVTRWYKVATVEDPFIELVTPTNWY